jgi:aerobic-type carbon monoxide dehydrogenase small subunit (CoxS/CutS family)
MAEHRITLTVNGVDRTVTVPSRLTLADALREELDLVGTHLGCEHGICGSCTVLIDGEPARSCTVLAATVDGSAVRTVEGLAADGELTTTQRALRDHHGIQCGFCTPGLLMTLEALLAGDRRPSRADLMDALAGVLCRCTGYVGVLAAAEAAVEERYGSVER